MSDYTFTVRLQQLIAQLEDHPNRDEILELANEQFIDDTYTIDSH
jgi:hypothetical protein